MPTATSCSHLQFALHSTHVKAKQALPANNAQQVSVLAATTNSSAGANGMATAAAAPTDACIKCGGGVCWQ
jgi:hypothetical protein